MIGEVYRRAFAAGVVDLVSSRPKRALDRRRRTRARCARRVAAPAVLSSDVPADSRFAVGRLAARSHALARRTSRQGARSRRLVEALEKRAAEASYNGSPSPSNSSNCTPSARNATPAVRAALREPRYRQPAGRRSSAPRGAPIHRRRRPAGAQVGPQTVRKVWRRARRCVREHERRPERTNAPRGSSQGQARALRRGMFRAARRQAREETRAPRGVPTNAARRSPRRRRRCRYTIHATAPGARLETRVEEDEASLLPRRVPLSGAVHYLCHPERSRALPMSS